MKSMTAQKIHLHRDFLYGEILYAGTIKPPKIELSMFMKTLIVSLQVKTDDTYLRYLQKDIN
jgi:hypothetical protein